MLYYQVRFHPLDPLDRCDQCARLVPLDLYPQFHQFRQLGRCSQFGRLDRCVRYLLSYLLVRLHLCGQLVQSFLFHRFHQ